VDNRDPQERSHPQNATADEEWMKTSRRSWRTTRFPPAREPAGPFDSETSLGRRFHPLVSKRP
jgi:hypothetical protein